MEELILLGLLMTIGFIAGSFGERRGIPRVAMYVVVGALFSNDLFGRIFLVESQTWTDILTTISLGIIAFIIGSELNWRWIKAQGKSIVFGVFGQSMGTVFTVALGIWMYSELFLSNQYPLRTAIILGAIASATAPAATVAIIEEYRTKGPLTSMLLSIVAIDDALAIVYFTAAMSFVSAAAGMNMLWVSLWEIVGSLLLGGLLGGVLGWYARRIKEDELRLPIVLGFIFSTISIAQYLHISALLSCMSLGFISKLMFRHKTEQWLEPMDAIRESIFLIFFTLAGTHFQFDVFYDSFGFIAVYILLRTLGKYGGALSGTVLGGAPRKVSHNVGWGLLPQAGVAIGLALRATETTIFADHGALILNTVLGSTIVFALASPGLTKKALGRAGEIGKR